MIGSLRPRGRDEAASHSRRRIEGLDALRFFAAMAVLCYHFFYAGPVLGYMPAIRPNWACGLGHFGVDAFFVISGFVISFSSEGTAARDFLVRRFLRLMPAFFICSMISALLIAYWRLQPPGRVLELWLAGLTFMPHLFGLKFLQGVYWTLAIEVTFYLWVTLMIAVGFWGRGRLTVIAAWLALALVNGYALHSQVLDKALALTYAGHFATGVILHAVLFRGASRLWLIGLVPAICLMTRIALIMDANDVIKGQALPAWASALVPWVVIAIVLAAISLPQAAPRGLTTLMGKKSYPLYLLHASLGTGMANSLGRHMNPILGNAIAVIAIVVIAALVAIFGEAPLRRLLRRWLAELPGGKPQRVTAAC